jgi:outer membrane protein assembly factor BamD (BamD/ComL family)
MRKSLLALAAVLFVVVLSAPAARAQGSVKTGPDPSTIRDPDLEKDSMHNLEVARNYFKLRKAYVATLKRCEEIIAGNPNFAKLEEVLFMAGQSSLSLAQNKGKQSPSLYVIYDGTSKRTLTPEEFRELGREYLTRLINEYPNSSFREEAEYGLRTLGEPKAKP